MMPVHHAFAHIDHPECPWLGTASSNDFGAFKKQIVEADLGCRGLTPRQQLTPENVLSQDRR